MHFSKSDQEGYGKHTPLNVETVTALQEWKEHANITDGKVLRGFIRQQTIGASLDPIPPVSSRN